LEEEKTKQEPDFNELEKQQQLMIQQEHQDYEE
jgi:hypothetical protein